MLRPSSNHVSPRTAAPRLFWPAVAVVLLLAAGLRLTTLTRLPLFGDEALHLGWVHQVLAGNLFGHLIDNKWLLPVTLAIFYPAGPEALWLSRALAGLAGVLTTAACIGLGCSLDRPVTGLAAGLLYALMPLAVFHERQTLTQPQMIACLTFSAVLAVRLMRRPAAGPAILQGIMLAAAYLTTAMALPFFVVPLAALILPTRGADWRRALAAQIGSLVLAGALIGLVQGTASLYGYAPLPNFQPGLSNSILGHLTEPATLARFLTDVGITADALSHYTGPVVPALAGVALLAAIRCQDHPHEAAFLAVPAVVLAAVPFVIRRVTAEDVLVPRYFMVNQPALAVLTAMGLRALTGWLGQRRPALSGWAAGAVVTAFAVPMLWFNSTLIRDPQSVPLPRVDREYQYGGAFAYDLRPVCDDLLTIWRENGGQPINLIVYGFNTDLFSAPLGPRVVRTGFYYLLDRETLADWLSGPRPTYLVDGWNIFGQYVRPPLPHQFSLTLVRRYQAEAWHGALYRVTLADTSFYDEAYSARAPEPEQIADDYASLSAALKGQPAGRVLVFPAAQASGLDEWNAEPILVGAWPLTPQTAGAALDRMMLGEAGDVVHVILVHETRSDPAQAFAQALQARLYRLDESWYGVLHRMSYATGPALPEGQALGAVWEDAIELVTTALLDPQVEAGSTLRLALTWRTSTPISDSFKVFVHVVDGSGRLWAQSDSIPGGGLLPMTSWQAGETITDRLAIRLPPDLPPGLYEVRAGIYHPVSGLRLRVTGGGEGDYVVIGHIEVRASP
jgi:hypothetical protein